MPPWHEDVMVVHLVHGVDDCSNRVGHVCGSGGGSTYADTASWSVVVGGKCGIEQLLGRCNSSTDTIERTIRLPRHIRLPTEPLLNSRQHTHLRSDVRLERVSRVPLQPVGRGGVGAVCYEVGEIGGVGHSGGEGEVKGSGSSGW